MAIQRAAQSRQELALLHAVTADLSDPVTRGVYTDWLLEAGDPRGTFLHEFLRAFDAGEPLPEIPADFSPAWAEVLALPQRRRMRHGVYDAVGGWLAHSQEKYPHGFPEAEPIFAQILRDGVPAMRATVGELLPSEQVGVGRTRGGGLPDLPVGTPWPVPSDSPEPPRFLFQLDLADLHGTLAEGLYPDEGLLLVFYLPTGSCDHIPLIQFVPPGTPLRPVAHPLEPAERLHADYTDAPRELHLCDSLYFGNALYEVAGGEVDFEDLVTPNLYLERRPIWLFLSRFNNRVWRQTEIDTPEEYLMFAEFPSSNVLNSWAFGDGDRMYLFVRAATARSGDFSDVQMLDY